MPPGDYEFNTGAKEVTVVLGDEMRVLLPGSAEWQTFRVGESFTVPANSPSKLHIEGAADYCYSYG
jgi:uncharacterized protein YaiE (UPF0345 family)